MKKIISFRLWNQHTKMATIFILANTVRPSVDCRLDDAACGREHSHGKTQYIHGKQVLVDCRRFILLQRGFKHIVICLKFCCHHVIMTFPPEWITALAVICSMCVRAIFNSTFRKHQSLSKSKHNHCQLNKFWTLNSRHIPFFTFFSSPLVYVLWRCQWLHLFFPGKL